MELGINRRTQYPIMGEFILRPTKNGNIPTFLKWAGGKTQLLSQYSKLFPQDFDRYIEPFLGGGAIFFYIKKNFNPGEIILADINKDLINCFKIVQNDAEKLISQLKKHKKKHSAEYYCKHRNFIQKDISDIGKAAWFIYYNKTCWNGLYRVNSNGAFNVPISDKIKNNGIFNEKVLREASAMLQGVKLKVQSFEKVTNIARRDDFVYLDPPYYPVSKTSSFTNYTKDSFSDEDQRKLSKLYKKLDRKGCLLMLSNSDHPFIKNLYDGYRIEKVGARRMINCDAEKRGTVKEITVLNY